MKKPCILIAILLAVFLYACSASDTVPSFSGGTFYSPSLVYSSGEAFESYQFNPDGTGTITRSSGKQAFTWEEIDGYIMTSCSLNTSSVFRYENNCLIVPISAFDGIIPNSDLFNTSVTKQSGNLEITLSFHSNGEVEQNSSSLGNDSSEASYQYIRNDHIIEITSNTLDRGVSRKYYTSSGVLYGNFLIPVE